MPVTRVLAGGTASAGTPVLTHCSYRVSRFQTSLDARGSGARTPDPCVRTGRPHVVPSPASPHARRAQPIAVPVTGGGRAASGPNVRRRVARRATSDRSEDSVPSPTKRVRYCEGSGRGGHSTLGFTPT
ncbi:hypothetical protein GCM10026982_33650 [Nocardiopsis aegyptia]